MPDRRAFLRRSAVAAALLGPRRRQAEQLANASADAFYGGLVSFEPVQGDLRRVVEECAARKTRIAGGAERVRVATQVFTQPTELQAFFDAVHRPARG